VVIGVIAWAVLHVVLAARKTNRTPPKCHPQSGSAGRYQIEEMNAILRGPWTADISKLGHGAPGPCPYCIPSINLTEPNGKKEKQIAKKKLLHIVFEG